MKRSTLQTLCEARRAGRTIVRALVIESGEERLIGFPYGDTQLERAAAEAARADRSGIVEISEESWFLEVRSAPLELNIVGAVHIAQPLAQMAMLAGYRVRVVDPRRSFANPERFPGVDLSLDWPDEAFAGVPLGPRSAVAALAHDPKLDEPALSAALRSDCFYIGALGSKRTHQARLARLKDRGFDDENLARIHGPIGLAIGARSPAEIAISILAEMTMRLRADEGWERSIVRASADTGLSPRS
jgi:xanthine dehydrogenase accessory factor